MDYDFAGLPFESPLPNLIPQKRKRGRPPAFSDEALVQRCYSLLTFFEYHWAEVAWQLARARSLPKLRDALRISAQQGHHGLDLLLHEQPKIGTPEELKEVRYKLTKAQAQFRSALEDEPDVRRKFEQAGRAIEANPDHPRLPELHRRAERNWRYVSQQIETLRFRIQKLSDEVLRRRAHLAQSQLLTFLESSKRYQLNPTNLCKAMAGVPEMSWRQSAARMSKLTIKHPFEAEYEAFCVVNRALGTAPKTAEKAKERVRRFLVAGPKRLHVFKQLRQNFYFIQVGVDYAYAATNPRSAVPYLTYEIFRRRRMAPQPGDELVAEEEQL
jgi:hypothetical protein